MTTASLPKSDSNLQGNFEQLRAAVASANKQASRILASSLDQMKILSLSPQSDYMLSGDALLKNVAYYNAGARVLISGNTGGKVDNYI